MIMKHVLFGYVIPFAMQLIDYFLRNYLKMTCTYSHQRSLDFEFRFVMICPAFVLLDRRSTHGYHETLSLPWQIFDKF